MSTERAPITPDILEPGVAAARLGVSVPTLVAILRKHRYHFTELAIGGKPGDRGRFRWGLTEPQLQTIIRGQERGFVEPKPAVEASAPPMSPASPDGRSRLRRGRLARS
jgi:hypothetical protein